MDKCCCNNLYHTIILENSFEVNTEWSARGYIEADINGGSLSYTTSDSITISIRGNVPTTWRKWVSTSWYFNGQSSYPSGTSISNLLKLQAGLFQSLTINNPTPLHAGTFETLLILNPLDYLQQLGCPDEYRYFVYYNSGAGVGVIILDQVAVDLKYYGKSPQSVNILMISMFYMYWLSFNRASYNFSSVKQASS